MSEYLAGALPQKFHLPVNPDFKESLRPVKLQLRIIMTVLEYPVTRPIPLGRITLIALVISAVIFIGFVTIINLVAVGYELVSLTSNEFNPSNQMWYDKFIPASWRPTSVTCGPAVINLNEG